MDLTQQLRMASRLIEPWLAYKAYIHRLPGLSTGIIYRDQLIYSKCYGYADLEQKIKTEPTTCYRIASISKIFTTVAIMQLFEEGKLNLDAPVQQYLSWWPQQSGTAHITARQLLTHTSGLDRDGDTPHWTDFKFPSREAFRRHINEGALVYTPATRWKYSNIGFTVLGEIVEAVSGLAYTDYIQSHIVEPLGIKLLAPAVTNPIKEHLAFGYTRDLPEARREPFPLIDTNCMAPAAGFATNVEGLSTFMRGLFDGNARLLSDETKREMRRVQWIRSEPDADWCLGFETWQINGRRFYGHGGSLQGFKSRFAIDPDRELGIIIFSNAMEATASDLANGALRTIDHVITHFAEYAKGNEQVEDLTRYEGTFRNIWGDTGAIALGKRLYLYDPGAASPIDDLYELRHQQDDSFIMESGNSFDNIGEVVRFIFDDKGDVQELYSGSHPSGVLQI